LLARLLALWAGYRRAILISLLLIALAAFFTALAPQTRSSLLRGLFANRVLVVLLLSFILLMLSLLFSAGQRLDAWIFLLFNLRGYHPLWLDRFMWGFTQIGNGIVGLGLSAALYLSGLRSLGVQLLAGILTLWLVVEVVKALVDRRRPYIVLESTRIIGWRERGLSFPSGHTAQTFFMTTLFVQYLHTSALLGGLLYLAAALVGFTRVYVGAHYPRDVLAGAMLGSVWGLLIGLFELYFGPGIF
jgi:membrane-associated phospholipid phosphatase